MGYVTKLEQGYASRPSSDVVEKIADALRVNAAERDHLHALSDPPEPDTAAPPSAQQITQLQRDTAEALNPHLVAYVSETWDVLYANAEYARLFRHIANPRVGNVLRWFFLVPESRKIMTEWEPEARLTVAWLRALMARRRSPMFGDLLDELCQEPEFRRMWEKREVILGRHQSNFYLYDLDRGEDVTLLTQVYPTPDPAQPVMMYLGTRVDLTGQP